MGQGTRRAVTRLLLLTSVAFGCSRSRSRGGPPPFALVAASSAPAGAAGKPGGGAVIAYADKLDVCSADLTEAGLLRRACAAVTAPVDELAWRGGDIFARLRTGEVVRVHDGQHESIPSPPTATWAAPKPSRPGVEFGPGSEAKLVITAAGEVWLGRCAWTSLLDRPACEAWVYARLVPSLAVQRDPPKKRPPAFAAGLARPPAGVAIQVEQPVGPGEPAKVVCTQGTASSTFTSRRVEGATAGATVTWIAEGSPYYLLDASYDYIETIKADTYLMKACDPHPIESLASSEEDNGIVWGPSGYWLHRRGSGGWVVRSIERAVAELPAAEARPAFQPR